MRSRPSRVALSTWLSDLKVPEYTRKSESLPTWGSEIVLNTSAVSGALGSGARVTGAAWSRGSMPSTVAAVGGRRELLHDQVEQRPRRRCPAWPRRPARARGAVSTALRSASSISASPIEPSSRYLARRSSSVSAAASTSFSRYALTASITSPGISASLTLPSAVMRAFYAPTTAVHSSDGVAVVTR